MRARIKEDDSSVPAPDGPFDYFIELRHRRPVSALVPRAARRRRRAGPARRQRGGRGQALLAARRRRAQPRPPLLAYAVDDKGSELYTIRIRDLATGQDLPDVIPDTRGAVVWARDSRTLFYVRLDANHRPLFVYRHRVGTPAQDDVLVYEEKDIGFYVGVGQTQSGRFIVIDAHDHQTNEVYLIDADAPDERAAPGRAARARPRVRGRAPRRPADHH